MNFEMGNTVLNMCPSCHLELFLDYCFIEDYQLKYKTSDDEDDLEWNLESIIMTTEYPFEPPRTLKEFIVLFRRTFPNNGRLFVQGQKSIKDLAREFEDSLKEENITPYSEAA